MNTLRNIITDLSKIIVFKKNLLVFTLLMAVTQLRAQIPGESYFDNTGYIEYIAGNYPVILSVPHGGDMFPNIVPDRVCVDLDDDGFDDDFDVPCGSIVTQNDSFTQEIGRSITAYFHEQTGFYPHVVINRLRRIKLDTNRSKEQKPYQNGGGETEEAWDSYQDFIEGAKTKIIQDFDRGLLIDVHGHGHQIKRIELGYTLTHDDLDQSDETLNTPPLINKNSLKNLVGNNALNLEHSELIRGPLSFGALIHNMGYPAVPSPQDPSPNFNEPYFTGGYNVLRHGAHFNDSFDAFQIECDQNIRINGEQPKTREQFAELCATAINEYLSLHYGVGTIDFDKDGVFNDLDCNDFEALVNPNVVEVPYNGVDDDCNPNTPDDDLDGDGFINEDDCNDNDAAINPDVEEIPYNGIDEDCNPDTLDDDLDGDGFTKTDDCNDNDATINPDSEEIPYNGIDNDCNPDTPDDDLDSDGFINADDCNDNDVLINPDVAEIPYNGIDDDCNPNTLDDDLDNDGFIIADDCNDNDALINPEVAEIPYNGIDDDCNPDTTDEDIDGDGFINVEDCDDNNALINQDAVEIPYNGTDDDCNPGTPDDDLDGDGFINADDCDDNNPSVNPDAEEIPNNNIDDDCNPTTVDKNDAHIDTDITEIIEKPKDTQFVIYPVPTEGLLYISGPENVIYQVSVFDNTGRIALKDEVKDILNVEQLQEGVYTLIFLNLKNRKKIVKKIAIQK